MAPALLVLKPGGSSKRLMAVAAALVALAIAVAGASIRDLRGSALENSREGMRNLGGVLAEELSRSLQAVELVLDEMQRHARRAGVESRDDLRQLMSTEAVHAFLAERVRHLPQAGALIVLDDAGRLVNFSRFWPPPPLDFSRGEDFRQAGAPTGGQAGGQAGFDRMLLSAPVRSRTTGNWTLYVGKRIVDGGGRFLGMAQAALEVGYFERFYAAIGLGEGATVSLLRRDGMFVARHPETESVMGQPMPPQSPWYDRVARGGGAYTSPGYVDGTVREVTVHPLKDYPLVVTVTVPTEAALAHWRHQAYFIGGGALCAILGTLALFSSLATQFGRLERSEQALSEAMGGIERASRAKSDFLTHMSHELRTPLNAIIGFSEVMAKGLMGPLGSPRYQEYAQDILRSGRYLHDLISDMLDMAKIEAGRRDLRLEAFDAALVIDDVLRMLHPRAQSGRIAIEAALAELPLRADRRAFKQIILNLIGNAVKFTPSGGAVTVRLTAGGGDAMLQVVDTGIGIAPEDIAKLGTPFFRSESPQEAGVEGTGLGLALTKSLVQLHGWSLAFDSEVGRGTTVTVHMPNAACAGIGEATPAAA
ncbi:MAG: hypothetical protein IT563_10855 [Alphaproteobacteria bacterium]|nr:hypothetical protein [Alphaproteobacteria bacterium]